MFLLNEKVWIHISEETLDGMMEYTTKQELHVNLEGAGEFVLKIES